MIPVALYKDKLQDLDKELQGMGREPESIIAWLQNAMRTGDLKMAQIQAKGAESMALVRSLPKTDEKSVLGLKLTDNTMMKKAMRMLSRNEAVLFEEINDLERIQRVLNKLHNRVKRRLDAVKSTAALLNEQARTGGEQAGAAREQADTLYAQVVPVLRRLANELYHAVKMCNDEIRMREDRIGHVNRRQLSIPKYNRRARRKRQRRAALKDPKRRKEWLDNEADGGDDDGGGGGGGGGD